MRHYTSVTELARIKKDKYKNNNRYNFLHEEKPHNQHEDTGRQLRDHGATSRLDLGVVFFRHLFFSNLQYHGVLKPVRLQVALIAPGVVNTGVGYLHGQVSSDILLREEFHSAVSPLQHLTFFHRQNNCAFTEHPDQGGVAWSFEHTRKNHWVSFIRRNL